jgi:transcriptional regulator with XRE-family HTH domain
MLKISIKSARVNAGYSQKKASSMLGVSNKTLSSWENGITVPKADMVDKICQLYKVEYDNLIFLPNNPL